MKLGILKLAKIFEFIKSSKGDKMSELECLEINGSWFTRETLLQFVVNTNQISIETFLIK